MAFFANPRTAPRCLSCLRNTIQPIEIPRLSTPFQAQVRGAKKAKLPRTVHVRLLNNILGYGPKGSILAVAPGRMRNKWYPAKQAQYVTAAELKGQEHLIIERDASFGLRERASSADIGMTPAAKPVEIKLLSSARSRELISTLVPDYIDFHRQPILPADIKEDSPIEHKEAANAEEVSKNVPTAIYGSVSISDILTSIKEALALRAAEKANEDAARVVLNPEDVKIIRGELLDVDTTESDRVKVLGKFDIELQVRGEESVRRKIRINAQV